MKSHESETVELKKIYTPDFKKETVAFANTNGGTTSAPASEDGIRMMIKKKIKARTIDYSHLFDL